MKLTDITKPGALSYLERYVDEKNYSQFSNYSEVEANYQPGSDAANFDVPYVKRPISSVEVIQDDTSADLLRTYIDGEDVYFPVHPQVWANDVILGELGLGETPSHVKHAVEPTASTRTVLVPNNGPAHYLKLHLPFRISRFSRRWRRWGIDHSLAASRELSQSTWTPPMGFLRDVIGVWDKSAEWGYSVREATPFPASLSTEYLIPYFSLYSRDVNAKTDEALLTQLIKHHGVDPSDYFVEQIIGPLITGWAEMITTRGLVHASHGQNTLLALDDQLVPVRPIYRDLEAVGIDQPRREALKLDTIYHKHVYTDPAEVAKFYSETYDYQIGHHLFEPLLEVLVRDFEVDPAPVRAAVAAKLRQLLPDWPFPDETYRFGDTILADNARELVADPELPRWR